MSKDFWFQFHPKDFLSDKNVQAMSDEQIGIYIKLICHCWLEGSIPNDPEELAAFATKHPERFSENWKRIEKCFEVSKKNIAELIHPRLEKERKKNKENSKKKKEAGKIGAERRWGAQFQDMANAIPLPSVCHEDAIAKNGYIKSKSNTETKENTPLPPQGESMFFAQFWAEYPKKVTKKESAAYWQQNKLDRRFTEILNGLHAWKMTDQWQKDGGKYIPDAIRFLRKERWLDEAPALPKPANGEKPKSFKQRIMEAKRIRNKYDGTVVEMSDLRIENDQICDLHGQLFPYQDYEPIEETL